MQRDNGGDNPTHGLQLAPAGMEMSRTARGCRILTVTSWLLYSWSIFLSAEDRRAASRHSWCPEDDFQRLAPASAPRSRDGLVLFPIKRI